MCYDVSIAVCVSIEYVDDRITCKSPLEGTEILYSKQKRKNKNMAGQHIIQ